MTTFIIRRLAQGFVILILSTALIYLILTLTPGGPLDEVQRCGARLCTRTERCSILRNMGIVDANCRPYAWYERYARWLFNPDKAGSKSAVDIQVAGLHLAGAGVLTGDWGTSITLAKGQRVTDLIGQRLPYTLVLSISSLLLSILIAVPIGIISAVKQYSKLDYSVTLFSFFGLSMPPFWFGWMLIIIFAVQFKQWHDVLPWIPYLPPAGAYTSPDLINDVADRVWHLILPVTVLSLLFIANWSRFLRSSILEVLRLDYVRTAWAKGLSQRTVILKHALRNALIPMVTLIGLALPGLVGGAVIVETIFSYPGMGRLFFDAIGAYDWSIVMAYLLIGTTLTILGNLLADVLYAVVDPRIRVN